MYEYLSEYKPVHVMELPNSRSEAGLELWKNEIIKLKSTLEEMFSVKISEDDIRKAIIGCSCMSPNPNRIKLLNRMIDEYKVDAVVDVILTACHTYSMETLSIKRFVNNEKNKPYMSVETDFSTNDIGQLNTRMAAFIEML